VKRASLPPEATPGPGSSQLRIRLPDGSNAQRVFLSTHTLSVVYDFVDSLEAITFAKYTLVSNFPRRSFGPETRGMTLGEVELTSQAALFVQREDD
jgi:FAS-associated factor 2